MKKSLIPLTVVAVSAAAFVGCEWGGVHRGESWNDAYAWANFSGTYKLAASVAADDASGTKGDSVKRNFTGNGSYNIGKTAIVPGSVTITINGITFSDNSDGTTTCSGGGSADSASINYSAGTVSVSLFQPEAARNSPLTVSFKYNVSQAAVSESPITWINVTQKGNLLTMEDNNGTVYSGKITGASCPTADSEGYVQAAHIRFPFEVTSANGRVTLSGSLSGDWSGSSSETTGTLSNRTMDASLHQGKSAVQFMAVSGTVVLSTLGV